MTVPNKLTNVLDIDRKILENTVNMIDDIVNRLEEQYNIASNGFREAGLIVPLEHKYADGLPNGNLAMTVEASIFDDNSVSITITPFNRSNKIKT